MEEPDINSSELRETRGVQSAMQHRMSNFASRNARRALSRPGRRIWLIAALSALVAMLVSLLESPVFVARATLDLAQISGTESANVDLIREDAVLRRVLAASSVPTEEQSFPALGIPWISPLIQWLQEEQDPVVGLRRAIRWSQSNGGLISVSLAAHDPDLAAHLLNQLLRAVELTGSERRSDALHQRLATVREEIAVQKKRVQDVQLDLAEHWNSAPPVESEEALEKRIEQLEHDRIEARRMRLMLEGKIRALEEVPLGGSSESDQDPQVVKLRQQKTQLERVVATLSTQYKNDYPELKRKLGELNQIKKQLRAAESRVFARIRSDHREAQKREEALRRSIEEERKASLLAQQLDTTGAELQARVDLEKELLDATKQRLQRMVEHGSDRLAVPRILEYAEAPATSDGPRVLLRSVVVFLFVSFFLVASRWLQSWKRRQAAGEYASYTEVIPVDADVPLLPAPGRWQLPREAGQEFGETPLLASESSGPIFEVPNTFEGTLVFTSSRPREGKTTTALRVAESLARQNARVLLIDADFANPSVHETLGIRSKPGLGDLLVKGGSVEQVIQQSLTPGLYAISIGSRDLPVESVIASPVMSKLLRDLESKFDHVIIDAPAVDASPLSARIAGHGKGVVLVVNRCVVTPEDVKRARERLEEQGARIFGAIPNDVDSLDALFFARHRSYYASYESQLFRDATISNDVDTL